MSQTLLKHTKIWGLTLILICGLVFTGWWLAYGTKRALPNITATSIRAVQIGMTETEMHAILGAPIHNGPADFDPDVTTHTYTRPRYFSSWYPMLWVHCKDGAVIEVYAKRYSWQAGDIGVYGLTETGHWETARFEQTFPSGLVQQQR